MTFWLCNLQIFTLWTMQFCQSCSNSTGGNPDHFIGQCRRIEYRVITVTTHVQDWTLQWRNCHKEEVQLYMANAHTLHISMKCVCAQICVCVCVCVMTGEGMLAVCQSACFCVCVWHVWVNSVLCWHHELHSNPEHDKEWVAIARRMSSIQGENRLCACHSKLEKQMRQTDDWEL